MGQVAGYTAADYLIQHASRERRYERVPASTWDAVLSHVRDPADAARLADSARNRLLYCYAIPLYCHAADAGDRTAARQLAELLARRGDLDGLRGRADAGDGAAAGGWPGCWPSTATSTGPRRYCARRADAGDGMPPGGWPACWRSAAISTGCAPGPTPATGLPLARLAELLAERGDLDGAAQILRGLADAGDAYAALQLAEALASDLDVAAQILRALADAGERTPPGRLAGLLAERGDLERSLRARANAGDEQAALALAELLAERGDLEGARPGQRRRRAAAWRLAELLAERGDLDGAAQYCAPGRRRRRGCRRGGWPVCWPGAAIWTSCAPGPTPATGRRRRLADLLAQRGDLDGLRARADAGDKAPPSGWPRLLMKQGRREEAERLRRFGLNPDGSIACA